MVANLRRRVSRCAWLALACTAAMFSQRALSYPSVRRPLAFGVTRAASGSQPPLVVPSPTARFDEPNEAGMSSEATLVARLAHNVTYQVQVYGDRALLHGPLCVFVPANGHDGAHRAELEASATTWFDNSTVLFSESREVLDVVAEYAKSRRFARALATLTEWNAYQLARIMDVPSLRQRGRGGTAESIRGRGQLSIPLFHWISQLVTNNDPLVQNCKWFMKCDTDTYLRRRVMEDLVLKRIPASKSSLAYVGIPYLFNTRPYHRTDRRIAFEYNIGGPGYTFGRQLMHSVKATSCITDMAEEPVLLIHDDVATGFCAQYHLADGHHAHRIDAHLTAAASHKQLLAALIFRYEAAMLGNNRTSCLNCVASWHPLTPRMTFSLANTPVPRGEAELAAECLDAKPAARDGRSCRLTLMSGLGSFVGERWSLDPIHRDLAEFWTTTDVNAVAAKHRQRAIAALKYRDSITAMDER